MEPDYCFDVKLFADQVVEFIMSLTRIGSSKETNDLVEEYGIEANKDIINFVQKVRNSLGDERRNVVENYFSGVYLGVGLGLLADGQSIPDFISQISELSNTELAYYMLAPLAEKKITTEELGKLEEAFEWINNNFAFSEKWKWLAMKILRQTEEVKEEIIDLLVYYYNNYFKQIEDSTDKFLKEYIKNNQKQLIQSFKSAFFMKLSSAFEKNTFSVEGEIEVVVSYFLEFGSFFSVLTDGLVMGYRFPEIIEKLRPEKQSLLKYTQIFKVLADETRLKILLEINKDSRYLAELAEMLNSSDPAIKYHLNKLTSVGLIEIESSDNRVYYRVKREKFAELAEHIEKVFL